MESMVDLSRSVPNNPSFGSWIALMIVVAAVFAWGFVTSSK
jgi:hypothetical protein